VERRTALADEASQHLDHARRADAAVDFDRQTLLGPLVGHRQALELLAVGAPVEHEIVAPHLVRPSRRLRTRPAAGNALAGPLPGPLRFRRLPQPVGPAETHPVTIAAEEDAYAPIAIARILCRELRHARQHGRVLLRLQRSITQR